MKNIFVFVFFVFFGLFLISASVPADSQGKRMQDINSPGLNVKPQALHQNPKAAVKPDVNFGKIPLYFIFNKGQVNKKARFYAKTSRYTLWLTGEGLVFDSTRQVEVKAQHTLPYGHPRRDTDNSQEGNTPRPLRVHPSQEGSKKLPYSTHSPKIERDVSRLVFLNANKNPEIVPLEVSILKVNYFIGNDPSKWHCDVPTSKAVLYKNLYKNIDLKVYGIEKQIEYDWIVKPGGNPGDIRFAYKNIKGTRLDEEGNLLIETDFGELIHKKPVSYQKRTAHRAKRKAQSACPKERKDVNVTFKKIGKNIYGFAVGEYDKDCELIIDPVVLAYSTYIGGGAGDSCYGIAVDGNGNAYVTGSTLSADFPTRNQYQTVQSYIDAFVTKLDTNQIGASCLMYSTYLGGTRNDVSHEIAVDNSGNAYVVGRTESADFPTRNQYQVDEPYYDAFVTRLDTTQSGTSSLIYSTYLGGESYDYGYGIAADSSGYAYVTGATDSTGFPTRNQYQTDKPGRDVFVTKIDTNQSGASSLSYSTYLGGDSSDMGHGIKVDGSGNAYVTGLTYSTDFPTLNWYQAAQGSRDAFLTKIDTNQSGASSLSYSTYIGGGGDDSGSNIAVDNIGNAYVVGHTESTDFPTLNQYQADQVGEDAFITKIDTNQSGVSSLIYSTYLGGDNIDWGDGIAVDTNGNAYVTGHTISTDFPTLNQYQANQPGNDAFISKINTTGSGVSSLIYSTYLGGSDNDLGYGIALDNNGNVYVTGYTWSTNFPILNPYQTDQPDVDVFITKLIDEIILLPLVTTAVVSSVTPFSASGGGNVTSDGGAPVTARGVCWSTSPNPTISDNFTTDGTGTGAFTSSITGLTPNTTYYVRAYATNSIGTAYGNQITFTTSILDNPTISGTVSDGTTPIQGVTITFSHDGHTETTDADGYYAYTMAYGTSTTVTASKPGYTFTPSQYSYTNLTADQPHQDFTVLYSIFVTITNPHDGDTVSRTVMITAEVLSTGTNSAAALSSQSVTKVEFYIDGVLVKQDQRAPYKHLWNTTPVPDGNHTIKAKAYHTSGLTHQHQITVNVYNSTGPPYILLNRKWLNFGAVIGDSHTGAQRFLIGNSGGSTLNWTASVSDNWMQASPLSGTADAMVIVSVDDTGLSPGSYTGSITITDPKAGNSPESVFIYLEVKEKPKEEPLFGSFETPVEGSTVSGSIPVTGWAIDDVEVSNVKIFRNPLPGHETGLIYIGDAVFVEDARPDVEGKYPTYPKHYRSGWGYMMLTNLLPDEGNGTFVITAVAADSSGNEITLGTKTIICDNANAVKPFGAIDTPTQGGDASGIDFVNFGWALTPKPDTIPINGATIKVWVDGVPLEGNPVYNQYREDVAGFFPGYNNSDGAGGYYYLDTTLYANGVHTIAWSVTDDAGNTDGIGSRYFNIMNISNPSTYSASSGKYGCKYHDYLSIQHLPAAAAPVYLKKGYNTSNYRHPYYPGSDGVITIEIKENEPIAIQLGDQYTSPGHYSGYMPVGNQLKCLPVGSFLDTRRDIFYWHPGVGFVGEYPLVFIGKNQNGEFIKKHIRVMIYPKY
ncbi:MAG: SBBP repeat-containing protein [Candidatus Aminicenantes bacterium]|nr:MAG: SBBP repeat-containing protein [Candidatus Aminicenantes bacterium]